MSGLVIESAGAAPPAPRDLTRLAFGALAGLVLRRYASLRVDGRERLPAGPFILSSNHASHLDSLALMLGTGLPFERFRLLAARDYFCSHPLRQRLVDALVPILPIDRHPSRESVAAMVASCRGFIAGGGQALVIFPEGTRSTDGGIHPFKRGVAVLGAALDLPVVPALIEGSAEALPKGALWMRPRSIAVRFGAPVAAPGRLSPGERRRWCSDATREIERRIRELREPPDA